MSKVELYDKDMKLLKSDMEVSVISGYIKAIHNDFSTLDIEFDSRNNSGIYPEDVMYVRVETPAKYAMSVNKFTQGSDTGLERSMFFTIYEFTSDVDSVRFQGYHAIKDRFCYGNMIDELDIKYGESMSGLKIIRFLNGYVNNGAEGSWLNEEVRKYIEGQPVKRITKKKYVTPYDLINKIVSDHKNLTWIIYSTDIGKDLNLGRNYSIDFRVRKDSDESTKILFNERDFEDLVVESDVEVKATHIFPRGAVKEGAVNKDLEKSSKIKKKKVVSGDVVSDEDDEEDTKVRLTLKGVEFSRSKGDLFDKSADTELISIPELSGKYGGVIRRVKKVDFDSITDAKSLGKAGYEYALMMSLGLKEYTLNYKKEVKDILGDFATGVYLGRPITLVRRKDDVYVKTFIKEINYNILNYDDVQLTLGASFDLTTYKQLKNVERKINKSRSTGGNKSENFIGKFNVSENALEDIDSNVYWGKKDNVRGGGGVGGLMTFNKPYYDGTEDEPDKTMIFSTTGLNVGKLVDGEYDYENVIDFNGINGSKINRGVIPSKHVTVGSDTVFSDGYDPKGRVDLDTFNKFKTSVESELFGATEGSLEGFEFLNYTTDGNYLLREHFLDDNLDKIKINNTYPNYDTIGLKLDSMYGRVLSIKKNTSYSNDVGIEVANNKDLVVKPGETVYWSFIAKASDEGLDMYFDVFNDESWNTVKKAYFDITKEWVVYKYQYKNTTTKDMKVFRTRFMNKSSSNNYYKKGSEFLIARMILSKDPEISVENSKRPTLTDLSMRLDTELKALTEFRKTISSDIVSLRGVTQQHTTEIGEMKNKITLIDDEMKKLNMSMSLIDMSKINLMLSDVEMLKSKDMLREAELSRISSKVDDVDLRMLKVEGDVVDMKGLISGIDERLKGLE